MCGDGDVHHTPPMVGEHDQGEQQPTGGGWHHEEIRGHNLLQVIQQERVRERG
jgi:hypothetical protein